MEERVMPPPSPPPPSSPSQPPPIYTNQNQYCELQLSDNNDKTFVVQVPRDQIYRVPPPENARIIQEHQISKKEVQKRKRCWIYVRIILRILIVLIICGLLGGFYIMLNKPRDPRFSIKQFNFHNATTPSYNITLDVYNPNMISDISYKEGHVSLLTRQQEIASSTYPNIIQAHHSSKVVTLALKGLKGKKHNLVHKEKGQVTFTLSMHFNARTNLWKLQSMTKKYNVTCQMIVDMQTKANHVLSQDCQTKRH